MLTTTTNENFISVKNAQLEYNFHFDSNQIILIFNIYSISLLILLVL